MKFVRELICSRSQYYDADIRLQSVATIAVPHSLNYTYQPTINNDGPPPLATYGYENGLVKTIALENGLTTTTLRDAAQRVFSHSTAAGSNVKSCVAHGYDAAGRRTYASYEDALGQAYDYDNAGQVNNVIVNTANPATVNPTASPTHAYNYDPAGNRTSSLDAGITTNYATNSVNAYTSINNNSISHDPNGNMLNDANTSYTYDKENRLRTITQNGTTTGYTYDALSRCIESFTTSPTDNRERYTWSGWTLLNRELFTGTTPTSSFRYTWGLDLSESLEGAGGVAGLLAIERIVGSNTDIRFPHYDANGNIIALTDSTGNVSARYRYDAFGKVLSATDLDSSNWVTHNIHGFSTKPTFGNACLLYYGYRFYLPETGRWLNRDPIEENGGLNLYGFVGNDGVGKWDILGKKFKIRPPKKIPPIKPIPRPNPKPIRNPGDCTPAQHAALQAIVSAECHVGSACSDACPPTCDVWRGQLLQNQRCKRARDNINRTCFKGGNPGHKRAAEYALGAIKNCELLINTKCKN